MIKYSDYDFDNAAQAVYLMNDSARERYDSWQELREFMLTMASQYSHERITSFSTGGFQLSFTRDDEQVVYVTPSVSAFTAIHYAKSVKEKLNTITKLAA